MPVHSCCTIQQQLMAQGLVNAWRLCHSASHIPAPTLVLITQCSVPSLKSTRLWCRTKLTWICEGDEALRHLVVLVDNLRHPDGPQVARRRRHVLGVGVHCLQWVKCAVFSQSRDERGCWESPPQHTTLTQRSFIPRHSPEALCHRTIYGSHVERDQCRCCSAWHALGCGRPIKALNISDIEILSM